VHCNFLHPFQQTSLLLVLAYRPKLRLLKFFVCWIVIFFVWFQTIPLKGFLL
jgi:hypothetical protein